MSSEVVNLVAVLPDGREYFGEVTGSYGLLSGVDDFAEKAVRSFGIKNFRSDPIQVMVKIYRISSKNGKASRLFVRYVKVNPDLERMTQQEFDTEMESVVSEVPTEFHDFIKAYAWMEGHSSGRENVVSIASELVTRLADPIKAYEKSVIASRKKASKK